jgi:hypothetical protein
MCETTRGRAETHRSAGNLFTGPSSRRARLSTNPPPGTTRTTPAPDRRTHDAHVPATDHRQIQSYLTDPSNGCASGWPCTSAPTDGFRVPRLLGLTSCAVGSIGRESAARRRAPNRRFDGFDGQWSSSRPLRAYLMVPFGGVVRSVRSLADAPRRREVILLWSADGPHAIRPQSSSAINIQQPRTVWRPVFPGPARTYRQRPSTTANRWGSRSQGGGAGSNPVGATPLHPRVSGGCSHSKGPTQWDFQDHGPRQVRKRNFHSSDRTP